MHTIDRTLCAGCSLPHSPGEVPADMDIDEFTAVFVLRDPRRIAPGVAELLGVRWWSDLGRGDRHQRPNKRPFEHIDPPAVRAQAAELWPNDEAWTEWRRVHPPVSGMREATA